MLDIYCPTWLWSRTESSLHLLLNFVLIHLRAQGGIRYFMRGSGTFLRLSTRTELISSSVSLTAHRKKQYLFTKNTYQTAWTACFRLSSEYFMFFRDFRTGLSAIYNLTGSLYVRRSAFRVNYVFWNGFSLIDALLPLRRRGNCVSTIHVPLYLSGSVCQKIHTVTIVGLFVSCKVLSALKEYVVPKWIACATWAPIITAFPAIFGFESVQIQNKQLHTTIAAPLIGCAIAAAGPISWVG